MGRHSAPEDDEPSEAPAGTVLDVAPGRHHTADGDANVPVTPHAESATHGDLRLLREQPALRARCAAAAIVPFLAYTAALVVVGRTDVYLLWLWIPTVLAGIVAGAFLDAAHRRERKAVPDG
ncbi:MAG: hypothetical protein ABR604_06130 [Jatrophihabitantaceae bacterium]